MDSRTGEAVAFARRNQRLTAVGVGATIVMAYLAVRTFLSPSSSAGSSSSTSAADQLAAAQAAADAAALAIGNAGGTDSGASTDSSATGSGGSGTTGTGSGGATGSGGKTGSGGATGSGGTGKSKKRPLPPVWTGPVKGTLPRPAPPTARSAPHPAGQSRSGTVGQDYGTLPSGRAKVPGTTTPAGYAHPGSALTRVVVPAPAPTRLMTSRVR